ncbi:NINE protein [Paenibacillus sp. FSL H8-0034]|uniref:NINE protein n=1 Tax=Paenibacillus sp. FSL H8-0034 TaxID=2954671 RepID=UPI004046945B
MSTNNCPACGAPVGPNVTECKYCGENISVSQPQFSNRQQSSNTFVQTTTTTNSNSTMDAKEILETVSAALNMNNPNMNNINNMNSNNMNNMNNMNNNIYVSNKSKTTAGIFAILLGGLGLHHFYLDNIGLGIVYLLFCWTGIPSIIGLVEGIVYLTSSDQSFNRKYGKLKSF